MDDGRMPDPEVVDGQGAHRGTGLREQVRRELGVRTRGDMEVLRVSDV